MRPPVDLFFGRAYVAPKTLVIEAPTVEEATRKAQGSLPTGAKITKLEVVCDGAPVTVEDEGTSEDAALLGAKNRVPKAAAVIEQRTSVSVRKTVEGNGSSKQLAIEDCKRNLPAGANVEEEAVLQEGAEGSITLQAFSEDDARKRAQAHVPSGAIILKSVCAKPMSNGFFGFGRKPADYQISGTKPWRIRLAYCLTKVVVLYRLTPAVKIVFQQDAAESVETVPVADQSNEVVVQARLMWQKECDGVERTQQEAYAYGRALSLAGYTDWRLPTLGEFRSGGNPLARGDNWTSSDEPRLSDKVA